MIPRRRRRRRPRLPLGRAISVGNWFRSVSNIRIPALVASKTLGLATATANLAANKSTAALNAADYAVGQPYTPKLKSLSLDFLAAHEILLENYQPGPASDQIFHIHPFGHTEALATPPGQGFPFLPAYDNEGELYIGITALAPPETLSLLFQMAEGSANPDAGASPVTWSFLDSGGWSPVSGESILRDQSRGLINSGIIEFALPPATPDARLPGGFTGCALLRSLALLRSAMRLP